VNAASITMPAVFVGHGSPMNAIESNDWTRGWAELARSMPRPRAILAVSAHWYVPGVRVTAGERPRTIHDFGGFPPELYQMRYPAPGSAELCRRVTELIGTEPAVAADERWGLDHGTWSLLVHMYPEADIPVVQLSVDENLTPRAHYDLAKRLRPLRDEGVLILGSGNVVHNLHTYAWGLTRDELFDWGVRFNQRIREAVPAGRVDELIDYEECGQDGQLSVPTPEHYLPFLYVIAQCRHDEGVAEPVAFPVDGYDGGGSISMLSVQIG
jgi:4,5-DOPA dioxygenase extradiol